MRTIHRRWLREERPGCLSFGGSRMALLDVEAGFWGFRRQLEALVGRRLAGHALQEAGASGGAGFARAFVGQTTPAEAPAALRDCVAAYQAAGFGEFRIAELEWPLGHIVIRASDTFESWVFARHGQAAPDPVCAYTSGVFAGFASALADRRDVVCAERACRAQGAKSCVFELLPASLADGVLPITSDPDPCLTQPLGLLEILFDRMPMGIAVFDRDLALRRCNPTWTEFIARYTRTPASQVIPGARFFDLAPGTEDVMLPLARRVLAGETVRAEAVRLESGCIVSYWDLVAVPLYQDGVVGFVVVDADATERVRQAEALRLVYETLEQRVEEQTRELSTLLEVTRNVASTLELEPLLGLILDQLKAVVDYDAAWIFTLEGGDLKVMSHRGPVTPEQAAKLRFPVEKALIDREVVLGRKPLIIADVRGDDPPARSFQESAGEHLETTFGHIRSWLGVPLTAKERVIGKLTVDHSEPNHYTTHHAELAMAFADQVALAIENARLYERAQRRVAQLAALQRVGAAIAGTLDLPSLLQLIAQAIQTAAGFEVAVVSLVEGDPPALRRVASAGVDPTLFQEMAARPTPLAQFKAMAQDRFRVGGAYYFPASEAEVWAAVLLSYGVMEQVDWRPGMWHPNDLLIVPLGDPRGDLVGIISVDKPYDGRAPTAEVIEALELLANQAAIAIKNARLYGRAEEAAATAERNRLARDLHDAVTQTLFSASLIAEVLPRLWERDPGETRRRLEELRELTRGALAEMRTLLLELRPSALTEAALPNLLRQIAEATTGRARIPVSLTVEGQSSLPREVQVGLYRIAQEALNNVAKHSGASRATVSLRCQPDLVELCVGDDGRGFDPSRVRPDSLGLGIMRERVEAIGAELRIESQPGHGARVTVVWRSEQRNESELRTS